MSEYGATLPRIVNATPRLMVQRRPPMFKCFFSPAQALGQGDALRHFTGPYHAPKCDEQFAGESDDHNLARSAAFGGHGSIPSQDAKAAKRRNLTLATRCATRWRTSPN